MPSFTASGDWKDTPVSSVQYEGGSCPAGEYTVVYQMYEHKEQSDTFGFTSYTRMMPGAGPECEKGYSKNLNLRTDHQWYDHTVGSYEPGVDLREYEPTGNQDGSLSVTGLSISYIGAGISWNYDQPDVNREDISENTPAHFGHKWDWNSDKAENTSFEIASIADYNYSLPEDGDQLLHFQDRIRFGSETEGASNYKEYNAGADVMY